MPPGSLKSRMPSSPSGSQHAIKLTQPGFVVGEVAKAEGGGQKLERAVGDRQMQRVGLHRDGAMLPELRGAAQEHLVREVDGEHRHGLRRPAAQQRHRHVARTAADIGNTRLVAATECGGSAAPCATTRAGRWIPRGHGSAGRSAARWSRTSPLRLRLRRARQWCRRVARLASAMLICLRAARVEWLRAARRRSMSFTTRACPMRSSSTKWRTPPMRFLSPAAAFSRRRGVRRGSGGRPSASIAARMRFASASASPRVTARFDGHPHAPARPPRHAAARGSGSALQWRGRPCGRS